MKSFERYLAESLRSRVSCRTYRIYPRFSRRPISAWFRRRGGPPRCLAKTNRIKCPQARTDKTDRAEHRTRTTGSKIGVGLPPQLPHLVDAAPPDESNCNAQHHTALRERSARPAAPRTACLGRYSGVVDRCRTERLDSSHCTPSNVGI